MTTVSISGAGVIDVSQIDVSQIDAAKQEDFVKLVKAFKTKRDRTTMIAVQFDEYKTSQEFLSHCREFYWMTRNEQIRTFSRKWLDNNIRRVPMVMPYDLYTFLQKPEFYI